MSIETRKLGRVYISTPYYLKFWEDIAGNFAPFEVFNDYIQDRFVVTGHSTLFRELGEGEEIPRYIFEFTRLDSGKVVYQAREC